jgi:hypothetical protein
MGLHPSEIVNGFAKAAKKATEILEGESLLNSIRANAMM